MKTRFLPHCAEAEQLSRLLRQVDRRRAAEFGLRTLHRNIVISLSSSLHDIVYIYMCKAWTSIQRLPLGEDSCRAVVWLLCFYSDCYKAYFVFLLLFALTAFPFFLACVAFPPNYSFCFSLRVCSTALRCFCICTNLASISIFIHGVGWGPPKKKYSRETWTIAKNTACRFLSTTFF